MRPILEFPWLAPLHCAGWPPIMPHVGLVNQGRALQRVVGPLRLEVVVSQTPQLLVHQRHQIAQGFSSPCVQLCKSSEAGNSTFATPGDGAGSDTRNLRGVMPNSPPTR
jgi:hypothetical protein